jgi:hypothetical protein
MDRLQETCMLTVREGSGRFMTAAPLSKGELLRAKSGTGGLSNPSGDGERSGILPTPWAGASASGESWPASQAWAHRGVPAEHGISGSGENCGYHRGEGGGDGERETERAKEPGLVGGVGDHDGERPWCRNA